MKLELRSISRRLSLAAAVLTLLTSPAFPQVKLSQINNGGNLASATDQLVGVRSGTTDELLTVGSACVENLTSIVIDNGAGGLTLGAGQVTNAMLGNASTTVNGQTCTLGASCTAAAAAGTLTGSTLASGVTGSSLTSLGTIGTGVWQGTLIAPGYGGTGVSNTATLTLGSSNQNYAALGTGIIKNTTTTGALSNAAASDVIGLFSGCSGTQYLGADGACHNAGGGSGTVTSVTFTGDGTILSSTPSSAVTTSGTLTAALANQTANTVLGALTATTPSDLSLPSCSAAGNALKWTSGTGFGCQTGFLTAAVTSFSSGNLSPLFTTSVATSTTTPALSFTAVNQNANLVYAGPSSGAAAAPTFRTLVSTDEPAITQAVKTGYQMSNFGGL